MNAGYDYHGYTIENVYRAVPPGLREEILELWRRNAVIPSREEAVRRVDQVVLAIRNRAGEVAGVSTVYVGDFREPGDACYFYRMFIQPDDRIPGLMRFVTLRTCDVMRERHVAGGPRGVIIVTENRKLMRPGMRRMFERNGYEYMGRDPKGHDVWRALF
jgi:hypothetical protein